MSGGKINRDALSGFTEFSVRVSLSKCTGKKIKTRRWRDDLTRISFGGGQSDRQRVLILQTQEREGWMQEDMFTE